MGNGFYIPIEDPNLDSDDAVALAYSSLSTEQGTSEIEYAGFTPMLATTDAATPDDAMLAEYVSDPDPLLEAMYAVDSTLQVGDTLVGVAADKLLSPPVVCQRPNTEGAI